jgi:ABC-2 type transport system ATP-binding protein
MSSHLISDLERVCDYLIVLAGAQVQVAGPVDQLLSTHRRLSGPRRSGHLPPAHHVVSVSHTERQTTLVTRSAEPVLDPAWTSSDLDLDDLVLAYLERAGRPAADLGLVARP